MRRVGGTKGGGGEAGGTEGEKRRAKIQTARECRPCASELVRAARNIDASSTHSRPLSHTLVIKFPSLHGTEFLIFHNLTKGK